MGGISSVTGDWLLVAGYLQRAGASSPPAFVERGDAFFSFCRYVVMSSGAFLATEFLQA
jgi:hypothetical protein